MTFAMPHHSYRTSPRPGAKLHLVVAGLLALVWAAFGPAAGHPALAAGTVTLPATVPPLVAQGQAHLLGQHDTSDVISLAIGLTPRNQAALDHFLQNVTNPASPSYQQYLSQDQANQEFNPTPQQEQQVVSWLQSAGLSVTHTYPNHLLVDAQGTVAQIEQTLHVTINDYQGTFHDQSRTFFAPANGPTLPPSVSSAVQSIVGLDDVPRFHTPPLANGNASGQPPYYPQDFANAYDVSALWNAGATGTGQHIGITLWTAPPSDSTLQAFASKTGASAPTTANGRLNVVPIDGGTTSAQSPDCGEAGMDIEYSSGMAPGATIDYYEAPVDPSTVSGNCSSSPTPTDAGLLDALNTAGTDTNDNQEITDSWGGCEASSAADPWTASAEAIFAANTATGHTYFFSSGDNGSWCNPTGTGSGDSTYPDYPASSPYVTSVGGTTFSAKIAGSYPGETAWTYCSTCDGGNPEGSGGGYSAIFARPVWQTASGLMSNGKRGYPDIAADADPYTGAMICYGSGGTCDTTHSWGGTSLASPLWVGMLADINQYLSANSKPAAGFLAPTLYTLANNTQTYTPYHDVTSGTNGTYSAGTGWDAVTGWGSPDAYNIARDMATNAGSSPTPPTEPTPQALSAVQTQQYTLAASDGTTWQDMDSTNLALTITPAANCTALLGANADLWTNTAGYNQDIGIFISGGDYGTGELLAWKESGGYAGTFSPNAAYVQAAALLTQGTTYTVKLQWKTNKADPHTIYAGAGSSPNFSPTRLTALCAPSPPVDPVATAVSNQQYALTGNNGSTWVDMDSANLKLVLTPAANCSAILSGNADLWTYAAGYNQDLGIWISGGSFGAGQLVAWKESGGFAGTFSPNAAFVQTMQSLQAGTTYTIKLQWKTNKSDPNTIVAGAGSKPTFSPTRLTAFCTPDSPSSPVASVASTKQYTLTGNNGSTWEDMDNTTLVLNFTPAANCSAILSGNADLWTYAAGYNQDLGIWISGGSFGAGQLVAWKESGGFAGTFSPNAAFVQTMQSLQAGTTYTIKLQWKTNKSDPNTIVAGAGSKPTFSPTSLTVLCPPGS